MSNQSNLLVVNSSAAGEASVSRALTARVVAGLKAANPDLAVVERDVAADPVPHVDGEALAGFFGQPSSPAQAAARTRSDELIAELQNADVVVIGAPMYNFAIPSTLKAWFDHVLRAGVTFRYTETGPEGLLKGKRAIVVLARGGVYSEGPAQVMDAQEPHLRGLLGFVGITDVTFVRAEGLALGPEPRQKAIAAAESRIAELTALAA
jgi:FMN-dependent NADH-azoreductase